MEGLVINCGSSSIKLKLIEVEISSTIFEARAEHLGTDDAKITVSTANGKQRLQNHSDNGILDHESALQEIVDYLAFISSLNEICFVGHRVVHGGTFFSEPTLITDEVLKKIHECSSLAPLHNPASIIGIRCCQKLLPKVPQVAVFDTAFHQTIPETNYTYAIPAEFSNDGIRKYGFHGTSYAFLTRTLSNLVKKDDICAVMAHIGQGASVCAVKKGISVYTSMEFSPLSGCIMGTRSGNIDSSVVQYICNNYNYSVDEVLCILNRNSGLFALSGTNNMIEILEGVKEQKKECILALDMFCSSIAENIANCILALEEPPKQFVFSGGIGENSDLVREKVLTKLSPILRDTYLETDFNRNNAMLISTKDSAVKVYILPTNEELEIALESSKLIKN